MVSLVTPPSKTDRTHACWKISYAPKVLKYVRGKRRWGKNRKNAVYKKLMLHWGVRANCQRDICSCVLRCYKRHHEIRVGGMLQKIRHVLFKRQLPFPVFNWNNCSFFELRSFGSGLLKMKLYIYASVSYILREWSSFICKFNFKKGMKTNEYRVKIH